jgi:hypothetical protein
VRLAWTGIGLLALAGCGPSPGPGAPPAGAPPRELPLPAKALRPAEPSSGAAHATRAFLNDSQNGRSAFRLPPGPWALRVRAPLPWGVAARAVLTDGVRVLIDAPGRWVLLDSNGRLVRLAAPGSSCPVLDPAAKVFYYLTDRFGVIEAVSLDTGARLWDFQPDLPDGAARSDLRIRGRTLVAIATRAGGRSPVESFDLGPNPAVNEGVLTSARRVAALEYAGAPLAAASGERLALALKDRIVLTDWQLRLRDEFERPVEPAAVSLDEIGRVYLLSGPPAARQLAVYSPRGEQIYRVDLGRDTSRFPVPPLVSFEHEVYLLLGDRVVALSAEGDKRWILPLGRVAGGIVTADGSLLVTAGPQLAAIGADGGKRVLAAVDEPFLTAPVLTEGGEVLAATARSFVKFAANPR